MARFSDVDVFLAVADGGSFRGAATRLSVTRSTVSRAVARLEEHLGTALFLRDTSSVRLTAAGLAYKRWAYKAASALTEAERAARSSAGEVSGVLRITAPPALGPDHVCRVVSTFLEAHPDVDVQLLLTDRMVNPILDDVDIAVRTGPRLADSDLKCRRLRDVKLLAAATPELAQQISGRSVVPAVLFGDASGRLHSYEGGPTLRMRMRVNEYLTLKDAVLRGVGVGVLSELLIARELADGRLVRVLPEWKLPTGKIWAVCPSRGALPVRVRLMLDALVTGMAD